MGVMERRMLAPRAALGNVLAAFWVLMKIKSEPDLHLFSPNQGLHLRSRCPSAVPLTSHAIEVFISPELDL